MSYSILSRNFRFHSLIFTKNICRTSSLPTLFNTVDLNSPKQTLALQTSVETAIKTQYGIFRLISESAPVEYLQHFLVTIHDGAVLPWWATIICTTILLRSSITAPLIVYQHIIIGKLHNVNSELHVISKELQKEVTVAAQLYKWDQRSAQYYFNRSLKKHWNELIIRDNCHPAKTGILVLFQLPLWICFSVGLRNLVYMLPIGDVKAHLIHSQLSTEGFGWIINLTQVDQTYIFPVALGLINLAIIEIQTLSRTKDPSRMQRYLVNFIRGFSILMIPIAACVPAGVLVFWTTSSAYGLIQNLIIMSPKVKRFCRIPQTPSELEKPYSYVYNNFKKRIQFLFCTTK